MRPPGVTFQNQFSLVLLGLIDATSKAGCVACAKEIDPATDPTIIRTLPIVKMHLPLLTRSPPVADLATSAWAELRFMTTISLAGTKNDFSASHGIRNGGKSCYIPGGISIENDEIRL